MVVHDNSKDVTAEFLTSLDNEKIKVAFYEKNKGKGAALACQCQLETGLHSIRIVNVMLVFGLKKRNYLILS